MLSDDGDAIQSMIFYLYSDFLSAVNMMQLFYTNLLIVHFLLNLRVT